MSHQKSSNRQSVTATTAAVKKVMSTLINFERKLDKLQADVSVHGQALNELKNLVAGLPSGGFTKMDGKGGDGKILPPSRRKITTAIQYDHALAFDEPFKSKKKQTIPPVPSKPQTKNIPKGASENGGIQYKSHMTNKASSPRAGPTKLNPIRPSKAKAPRKTTTLRTSLKGHT